MHGVGYFLNLAKLVVYVLAYFWFFSLPLAAAWVWAFVTTAPAPSRGRGRLLAFGCLPPFVFPVGILICGVAFVSGPPWVTGGQAPAFPQHLVTGLLLVQVPLAGLAVWRWRAQWPAVVASWVGAGYVSLVAALISTSSVTGIWP